MDREIVNIRLSDERMHVHATFLFKNHGPATTVTMAFPDETSSNQFRGDEKPSEKHMIDNLWSTVDGKKVTTVRKAVPTKNDFEVNSVWLKTVPFARGQTRTVVVDYDATNAFAGNGYVLNTYILRTGATWRGSIGKCVLNVDWSKVKKHSRPALTFDEYFKRGRAPSPGTWHLGFRMASCVLTNIEPSYDLNLGMSDCGFWGFSLNGKPVPSWVAVSDYGDPIRGPRTDIQMPYWMIKGFFGTGDSMENERNEGGPLREFRLLSHKSFVVDGARHTLRRPARGPIPPWFDIDRHAMDEPATYLHLKDLVEALGGSYHYNARTEMIDVTVPQQRTAARKRSHGPK